MPINIATGAASLEFDDIEIPGRMPLQWNVRYSTAIVDQTKSPIGRGWFGLSFCLLHKVDQGFVFTTPRGAEERFEDPDDRVSHGGVVRNLGAYLELFQVRGRYVVVSWDVDSRQVRHYCFDADRDDDRRLRLTALENVSGDGVDLVWSGTGADAKLASLRQRLEGRQLSLSYDAAGWIEALTLLTREGKAYRLATYEHDVSGQLTGITDAAGFVNRFEYDRQARVIREINKDGGVFTYRYDEHSRCVMHSGLARYNERRLRYMQTIGMTEVCDSYGNTTTYRYLPNGQVVLEIDPLGQQRTTQYDEHGRTLVKTDANGASTTYAYDEMGNRSRTINPLGHSTEVRFNEHHQPVALTDASGRVWHLAYDANRRLIGKLDPLGGRWLFQRDANGQAISVRNPVGSERRISYQHGVLRSVTDWVGNTTMFTFDAFGRVTERQGPQGETTRLSYDASGNLIRVRLPDGSTMNASFDQAGNMRQHVDAKGATTTWRYGACRRLVERTDPVGGTLRYVWGSEPGRLEQLINENGSIYSFDRDAAGRIVAETAFDGARREFTYDAEGRITAFRNANGEVVSITRDLLGRIVSQCLPDGEELRFTFDQVGNLMTAVSADIAVEFERDALGRVVLEKQGARWIANRYDSAGGLTQTQTSTGHTARHVLDANGRTIELDVNGAVVTFHRDANGREVRRGVGDVARFEQRYDSMGRLIEQRLRVPSTPLHSASSRNLVERRFSYDVAGCLAEVSDGRWGTTEYAYDPAERLISAWRSKGQSEHFEYDAAGNVTRIQTESSASSSERLRYGPGNRLLEKGTTRYEYDAEGRRTKKIEDADGPVPKIWSYEWNAIGRLRRAIRPNGEVWSYRYDALARRVGKDRDGQNRCDYLWDCEVVAQELDVSVPTRTWLWEADNFAPVATVQGDRLYSVLNDHLGTPRELVDEDGHVVYARSHNSWGTLAGGVDNSRGHEIVCDIGFQGQWADVESGLSYNYFRYYDPECGRYLSPDPIGLRGGSNEFRYRLNPVQAVDPFGLCAGSLKDGDHLPTSKALDAAADHLGPGYKEVAPGVFKSADGTRMVRMTDSDLAKAGNHAGAPHMNFETGTTTTKPNGKETFNSTDNKHIFLTDA